MSAPYTPPPGPPPPSVPEGWKAQYDERYQAWFYVDLATGKSQWEKPEPSTSIAGEAPSGPPPSYNNVAPSGAANTASLDEKKRPLASNNPYNPSTSSRDTASPTMDSDAKLAAKLQAEEDARAGNSSSSNSRDPGAPDAASDYYSGSSRPQSTGSYASGPSSGSTAPEQKSRSKGGFLSKLMGKSSSSSRPPPQPRPQYSSYPQQPPPNAGYYDPNYGRYPQQPMPGYGYPAAGYGGYPQQGGYYPQQVQPQRKHGLGTGGAAALGVGGGLLGGMLLADAVEDMGDHHDYDNGGYDGGGYDGGGGGDFDGGGGDFGGGDF